MRVHYPELYEAHRLRTPKFLEEMYKHLANEKEKQMAERRGRKPKVASQAEQLVDALEFISVGLGDNEHYQSHIRLFNNMAVSFNGQMSAGHPIAEELTVCPDANKLKAALKKCGKTLVIAETPNGQLSIKGERLRALVPCCLQGQMPPIQADAPDDRAQAGDILKEAFKVCGTLASEAGVRVIEASLLLEANTCTGTNGFAMLQFWHGLNLPPQLVIPKVFAAAIAKQTKTITGVGFSFLTEKPASFTVWFDGGAWIKTLCYDDSWPDLAPILDRPAYPAEVPSDLWEAIEAVASFSDGEFVSFAENMVQSHETTDIGAQFDVAGLQGGKKFNADVMKKIGVFVKSIDLTTHPDRAMFFGGEAAHPIRGAIMASLTSPVAAPVEPPAASGWPAATSEETEGDFVPF